MSKSSGGEQPSEVLYREEIIRREAELASVAERVPLVTEALAEGELTNKSLRMQHSLRVYHGQDGDRVVDIFMQRCDALEAGAPNGSPTIRVDRCYIVEQFGDDVIVDYAYDDRFDERCFEEVLSTDGEMDVIELRNTWQDIEQQKIANLLAQAGQGRASLANIEALNSLLGSVKRSME